MDNFEQRLKVLKNSIRTVDVNHGLKVQVYGGGGAYFERRKWVVGILNHQRLTIKREVIH